MRSLDRPCAASNTILARTTSRYGDVYFLARASNSRRSSGDSSIGYGLLLDIPPPPPRWKDNESQGKMDPYYTSLYFLKIGLSEIDGTVRCVVERQLRGKRGRTLPRQPRPAVDWNRGQRQPIQLRLPFS